MENSIEMCGICCVISSTSDQKTHQFIHSSCLYDLLKRRGPDHYSSSETASNVCDKNSRLVFISSVLSMRSSILTPQPLENLDTGDILLYNGEIYAGFTSISNSDYAKVNDGEILLQDFSNLELDEHVSKYCENLNGPYCFVFYKKSSQKLYIARDYFGQRSLTLSMSRDEKSIVISSILPQHVELAFEKELKAGRVYTIDLNRYFGAKIQNYDDFETACVKIYHFNQDVYNVPVNLDDKIEGETTFDQLCRIYSREISHFKEKLSEAINKRLDCLYEKYKMMSNNVEEARIAILFSGGVDSLLLTFLINQLWPENWPIDLLNVSFCGRNLDNFESPDRVQGRKSLQELRNVIEKLNLPRRVFNFVEINIEKRELEKMRLEKIGHLIRPKNTVMDDSLGCILWFASRGKGSLNGKDYTSRAKALFLGSGADELLGGYARHKTHFRNYGYPALAQLLTQELMEISMRNFGRDDRVISDHGKESHTPFLDLDFVKFCNQNLPLNLKTRPNLEKGIGEKLILRLTLYELGFAGACSLPKKAMQFGTWLAKMENNREKGSDICDRLILNGNFSEIKS